MIVIDRRDRRRKASGGACHVLWIAWQAGRPDVIRSPRLVLAHVWEEVEW